MKSFAPITLALAAFSTLSLASPAGTRTAPRGRAVEVNAFLERSLLAARDEDAYHSAGPHHKGASAGKVRRHVKEAAKYKRSRGANRKRQDCDDEDEDDGSEGDNSSYSSSSSAPAAASPTPQSYSTAASYSSGSGSGSGSQSPSIAAAVTSSGSSSSSGSYDSSIPQAIQGTVTGGEATFYLQGGAAGSCEKYSQDSDKVVAVSADVMTKSLCGKTVQITNTANSKSVTATIQDTCPGCDPKHLDLSKGAFDAIGDEATGVLNVKWTITG